jgi:hypothetical protein
MNIIPLGMLILCCLPAFGFALRGIALLSMREVKPGRVISVTGVVAMISVWVFAGLTPFIVSEFAKIFDEFELELPLMTELMISISEWSFRYWILSCPFAVGLSLCALMVPEIFFGRRQGR